MLHLRCLFGVVVFSTLATTLLADESVEQIAKSARSSVVVITMMGRDGKTHGLGTGFVIDAGGLVATNLHVIGEGRQLAVETADGKRHEVTAVHASDRSLDLAVLRIDAKDLPALKLGDSDELKDGQAVVALGNPHGLKHSVVAGVVSAQRPIEGRKMIQLAIPLEPGNSGGPLLDMQGRVQGVLTLKSLVTENLGFAMPINALKPLLAKPNPIPMAHWMTIGALDTTEWQALMGARWHQRAGRLWVDGIGSGFGGRSLCLSQRAVPAVPYEAAVMVRLDDEAGAAGLVFGADGGDKHFGFYPTGGKFRLTRFDGPDVYSWKILKDLPSPEYRGGEWNTIKVRVEKDKVLCYVNGHLLTEEAVTVPEGKVGLAKFRDTRAEFRRFQVAATIPSDDVPAAIVQRVAKTADKLTPSAGGKADALKSLLEDAPACMTALRERAKLLEQQAAQLRDLAAAVHQRRVQAALVKTLDGKEDDIDLLQAALLIAQLDNEEVDIAAYRKEVERMAKELEAALPKDADEGARRQALHKFLFTERGFHGSRSDYYNKANSYLTEVIDDREGIPITLSLLYMDLAKRIGLKVEGVGLPGHFVVRHVLSKGEPQLIDVFEGGQLLSRADAERKVKDLTDQPAQEEHFAAVTKRAIIVRMLHNLLNIAGNDRDAKGVLSYLDTILAASPDAGHERWMRAVIRYQAGDPSGSREDADWLLKHKPGGVDLERVRELRQVLDQSK
jgi:regulator of sirC expression with transglutaminase-like and TPR domain